MLFLFCFSPFIIKSLGKDWFAIWYLRNFFKIFGCRIINFLLFNFANSEKTINCSHLSPIAYTKGVKK